MFTKFMNCFAKTCACVTIFLLMGICGVFAADNAQKPLIVYFSQSGNTRQIAEMIQTNTGADIFEIKTVQPYPTDYDALTAQAKKEQAENARPAIQTPLPNLDDYGVIFLGFPNWWSGMPMPVLTFIEQAKLDGKTVIPFVTHGGGNMGHIKADLKKALPNSSQLEAFSVSGTQAAKAGPQVKKWLEGLTDSLSKVNAPAK